MLWPYGRRARPAPAATVTCPRSARMPAPAPLLVLVCVCRSSLVLPVGWCFGWFRRRSGGPTRGCAGLAGPGVSRAGVARHDAEG